MRINSKSCPYIVADIGGTNTRFGLVTEIDAVQKTVVIENQLTYESASFDNIDEAVLRYKESLGDRKVKNACLAIAGPVVGDKVIVTNLGWNFSIAEVKEKLSFDNLMIIVLMVLQSSFIFTENIEEKRDHATWEKVSKPAPFNC